MTLAQGRPLSVVHFSTADSEGGSGRAAYRIHTGLRKLGIRSRMLVGQKGTNDPDVDTVHGGGIGRLKDRAAEEVTKRAGLQYLYYPSSQRVLHHPWVKEADVIQLFNTSGGYLTHRILPALSRQAPLVWRISDMWLVTGHCGYSGACERWKIGCGHCPDLATYPSLPFDTTALLWRIKEHVYRRSDITVVAPSSWSEKLAAESPLLNRFPIHRIPNGIDTDVFRPRERRAVRDLFGLDPDARLILFAAHVLDGNERKGAGFLQEALRSLGPQANTQLVLMGIGGESWEKATPLPVTRLGYLRDDRLLAAAYAASDVFVAPSLQDNLPNTALEALACGTPVIAFDTGGVADAVRHMETGYLAPVGDAAGIAEGVSRLLGDESLRERLGRSARRLIEESFSDDLQARLFAALYEEVVARRSMARAPQQRAIPLGSS